MDNGILTNKAAYFFKFGVGFLVVLATAFSSVAQQAQSDSSIASTQQVQLDSIKRVMAEQAYQLNRLMDKSFNDSLFFSMRKAQDEMTIFRYQFQQYYQQNKTANRITASGIAGIVLGTFIAIQSPPGGRAGPAASLFFIGTIAASVVAPIIRLNANKHLRPVGMQYKR